jgi:hypothetical protein
MNRSGIDCSTSPSVNSVKGLVGPVIQAGNDHSEEFANEGVRSGCIGSLGQTISRGWGLKDTIADQDILGNSMLCTSNFSRSDALTGLTR